MRHVLSLLAGLVIAPLGWFALALGLSIETQGLHYRPEGATLWLAIFLLLTVGVLLGLIGSLRTSPLGAMLVGAVYLSVFFAVMIPYTFGSGSVYSFFFTEWQLGDYVVDMSFPIFGFFPVIGTMLLMTAFSGGRWRAWPKTYAAQPEPVAQPSGYPVPSAPSTPNAVQPPTPSSGTDTSSWSPPQP